MTIRCFALLIALSLPGWAGQENNPQYLALGDSVAFGLNPLIIQNPNNFRGYPQLAADAKHVQHVRKLINTACPGETSGSFLSAAVPDNGCRDYKGAFGLHTNYSGAQLAMAVQTLRSGQQIELVTITLGANDLRVLLLSCNADPACILAGINGVLQSYGQNLAAILQAIRTDGLYTGKIVIVSYYSVDYTDALQTGAAFALNGVSAQVGALFGAQIADGFAAFAQASAGSGGRPCEAGLLIPLPGGGCDLHPSPAGAALLADALLQVIGKNK